LTLGFGVKRSILAGFFIIKAGGGRTGEVKLAIAVVKLAIAVVKLAIAVLILLLAVPPIAAQDQTYRLSKAGCRSACFKFQAPQRR
jgi:hypothetical protein